MTPAEWALLIAAIGGGTGLATVLRSLAGLRRKVDAVHHETSPNSGKSMNDAIMLDIKPQVEQLVELAGELKARADRSEQAAAERRIENDRRLDAIEKSARGTARDVGRVADAVVELAAVDRDDRERAERAHQVFDGRISRLEGRA